MAASLPNLTFEGPAELNSLWNEFAQRFIFEPETPTGETKPIPPDQDTIARRIKSLQYLNQLLFKTDRIEGFLSNPEYADQSYRYPLQIIQPSAKLLAQLSADEHFRPLHEIAQKNLLSLWITIRNEAGIDPQGLRRGGASPDENDGEKEERVALQKARISAEHDKRKQFIQTDSAHFISDIMYALTPINALAFDFLGKATLARFGFDTVQEEAEKIFLDTMFRYQAGISNSADKDSTKFLTYFRNGLQKLLYNNLAKRERKERGAVNAVSLSKPQGENGDSELGGSLADEKAAAPDAAMEMAEQLLKLRGIIATLDTREQGIIADRYGFGPSGRVMTLEELGEVHGVTKERVRQIEAKVLDKLQIAMGAKEAPDNDPDKKPRATPKPVIKPRPPMRPRISAAKDPVLPPATHFTPVEALPEQPAAIPSSAVIPPEPVAPPAAETSLPPDSLPAVEAVTTSIPTQVPEPPALPVRKPAIAPDANAPSSRVVSYLDKLCGEGNAATAIQYGKQYLSAHTKLDDKEKLPLFNAMGKAHLQLRQYEEAKTAFLSAYKINRYDKTANIGAGITLFALGDRKESRYHLEAVQNIERETTDYKRMAEILLMRLTFMDAAEMKNIASLKKHYKDKYREGRTLYNRIHDRHRVLPVTQFFEGISFLEAGDSNYYKEAENRFSRSAAAATSTEEKAVFTLACAQTDLAIANHGKSDEMRRLSAIAADLFQQVLAKHPGNEVALSGCVQALLKSGETGQAAFYLDQLKDLHPENETIPLLSAKLLLKSGDAAHIQQSMTRLLNDVRNMDISKVTDQPTAEELRAMKPALHQYSAKEKSDLHDRKLTIDQEMRMLSSMRNYAAEASKQDRLENMLHVLKSGIEHGMGGKEAFSNYNSLLQQIKMLTGVIQLKDQEFNIARLGSSIEPNDMPFVAEQKMDRVIEGVSRKYFDKAMQLDIHDFDLHLPRLQDTLAAGQKRA